MSSSVMPPSGSIVTFSHSFSIADGPATSDEAAACAASCCGIQANAA
ncbi:hypothetical protein [Paenibacillus cisolokensis]|nr:hypothetical protein [Paenibacillus cisolokensis]